MIVKIFILIAAIRMLITFDKPFLCSGVYAGIVGFWGLAFSGPVPEVFIGTAIAFALSSIYFWLLSRFSEGLIWWVIMLGGMFIVLL